MSADFGPFLQAAVDEFAGQQVLAATRTLNAQVADLTGQLTAARATLAIDDAAIAARDASIVALNKQVADLRAASPAPPLAAGWGKVTFFDDFTGTTNGDMAKAGHEDSGIADLTGWHIYALEREPGAVRWYIDDRQVFSKTVADLTWLDTTFCEPMNIRLNLQVGGSTPTYYGLNVDASTVFPADFVVDYVRVLTR